MTKCSLQPSRLWHLFFTSVNNISLNFLFVDKRFFFRSTGANLRIFAVFCVSLTELFKCSVIRLPVYSGCGFQRGYSLDRLCVLVFQCLHDPPLTRVYVARRRLALSRRHILLVASLTHRSTLGDRQVKQPYHRTVRISQRTGTIGKYL